MSNAAPPVSFKRQPARPLKNEGRLVAVAAHFVVVAETGVVGIFVFAFAHIFGRIADGMVVVAFIHDHIGRDFAGQPFADFLAGFVVFDALDLGDEAQELALIAVDFIQIGFINTRPTVNDCFVKCGPVFGDVVPLHRK